jgi:hypothetical protein
MTRTTNVRLAGSLFLLYIVIGISSMVLFRQAPMAVFEVTLALWLLIKGATPSPAQSPARPLS